jgi:xylulokinase
MKQLILAHDLGTTGNKATLYDAEGKLKSSAFSAYGTSFPHNGWAEQNPEDWWQAICRSTRQLLKQSGAGKEEIACIVFSGQMMGCVPLDRQARPLRSAIIWADQRAVAQERWLAEQVQPEEVHHITGHRVSSSYSLEKILWLRDNQPEVYRSAYKFMQAKDAMIARLTGNFVTEPSDASGMNLYDLRTGDWSDLILSAARLDPSQLPQIYPSTHVAGEVLPQAAEETGLAAGTPVVIGGGDGACAAAGAGVVREGSAFNYIGSSSWIAFATRRPVHDPTARTVTFGYVVPGMFTPNGTMQAAGASYQWLRDQMCQTEVAAAAQNGASPYTLMDEAAACSPAGANGLLFLPYLMGERSPRWNPDARGAFIGLTVRHTHADMLRAVLEGVTLNLRLILDALRLQGAQIDSIRVIGGGARGRFWNQLMADIYGIPVQRLAILEEATSMGAALTGGVGVGLYPGFGMAEQMNPVQETFAPDPAVQEIYRQRLAGFEAAYQGLLPLYTAMSDWD